MLFSGLGTPSALCSLGVPHVSFQSLSGLEPLAALSILPVEGKSV